MGVQTGIDRLIRDEFKPLTGRSVGLLCNQASISSQLEYTVDLFHAEHRAGKLRVAAVFGPQHGLFGHTQDNMIEWEGQRDDRTGFPVHSLYGEHREPTPEMLEGVEVLVVDLQDVGARYYTFIWTMALCMKACAKLGIEVMVLDRPNPIGGIQVEGTVLRRGFESFVGEYPLPLRHGMTIGEIARYLRDRFFSNCTLAVVEMLGWERELYFDETGLPWVMPSPNMPTLDTAIVYPGACLLEGTNLSEGRGTTRPFEIFGAPYLDAWTYASALNQIGLNGCVFRPLPFQPTFNKHAGAICGGCQVHVTDRKTFEPVIAYVAVIQEAIRQSGLQDTSSLPAGERFSTRSSDVDLPGFAWKMPPYEYVRHLPPIDILAGNDWLRPAVESLEPIGRIRERMQDEVEEFRGNLNPRKSPQLFHNSGLST
jgi:uncharacterized protein YbbC (DUF1343 family)